MVFKFEKKLKIKYVYIKNWQGCKQCKELWINMQIYNKNSEHNNDDDDDEIIREVPRRLL